MEVPPVNSGGRERFGKAGEAPIRLWVRRDGEEQQASLPDSFQKEFFEVVDLVLHRLGQFSDFFGGFGLVELFQYLGKPFDILGGPRSTS